MKKAVLFTLFSTLLLASCGGGPPSQSPQQEADADDSGDLTRASRSYGITRMQAASLGLLSVEAAATAPREPLTVTVSVKEGKAGTKNAGLKRAYVSWKVAGAGQSGGRYTLNLHGKAGDMLKTKTGEVAVSLPLPSGKDSTTRSRSSAYAQADGPACASLSWTWTPAPVQAPAPLSVCEVGAALTPQTGSPASSAAAAQAYLQPYADATRLPSDAPFAWTWYTAPDRRQVDGWRSVRPLAEWIAEKQAADTLGAQWEDFAAALVEVFGGGVAVYEDEVPCPNCHEFPVTLLAPAPWGGYAGFTASVFWDH